MPAFASFLCRPPMDTLERIRDILVEQLHVKAEDIQLSCRLVEDVGADELDLVEIAEAIGREWEIDAPLEEVEVATTVADLCVLVMAKVSLQSLE